MVSIKWDEVIPEAVKQARAYYNEFGQNKDAVPTLRAIYYRLVSVEAIPNTKSAYKGLSRVLSKARLDGSFPWELMQDKTRGSTGEGKEISVEDAVDFASTEVTDHLRDLKRAFEKIQNPNVNFGSSRWDGQDNRVIVAIEKEAIMGAVQNVLRGMDVEIFPLKGYTSTTFMRQIAASAKRLTDFGDVKLVIITDYDPSGEDMVRDLQKRLRDDYGVKLEAEKVLVTKEQIMTYDLPAIPDDAAEVAKLKRDPRFKNFADGVYRVELDAMAAIEPKAFRAIVKGAVLKHYDTDLHKANREETSEANAEAETDLLELYEKLKDVHADVLAKIAEIEGTD